MHSPFSQQLSNADKHLTDIRRVLSRGLKVLQLFSLHETPNFLLADRPVGAVTLIANQDDNGRLIRIAFGLIDPIILYGVKGVPVGEIEDEVHSMRIYIKERQTFIIGVDYRAEAFLPRRIPDLQLDNLVINRYRFESEIDPNGDHVILVELVIGES